MNKLEYATALRALNVGYEALMEDLTKLMVENPTNIVGINLAYERVSRLYDATVAAMDKKGVRR